MCQPLFKNLIQIGIVVKDLKKTMEKYVYDYGIGPMYVLKFSPTNVSNMYLYGKRKNYCMNIGVCPIGDVRFELIEPLGESIYLDYYKKYGEGIIHHLKLGVNNYHYSLNYLISNDIKIIQSGQQLGSAGTNKYIYLQTNDNLGFILEIVDVTTDFIKPEPDYWFPDNKENIPKPIFKRPSQLGIVVKNLKEKVKIYENIYGFGPWHIEKFNSKNIDDMTVYGKKKDYSMNIAFCTVGNVQLKLIEPLDSSIYSDFFDRYGDKVIHHLRMEMDDYNKTIEYLKSNGLKVIQSGNYLGKIRYSYLTTDGDINFIVELVDCKDKDSNLFCP